MQKSAQLSQLTKTGLSLQISTRNGAALSPAGKSANSELFITEKPGTGRW